MAEVQHSATSTEPIESIWDFVKEIDNWAPMVTGYQQHEKENENDSVWVLKGDLGSVTRMLKFKVHVTEWAGPERVTFELEGINEMMTGKGVFAMSGSSDTGDTGAGAGAAEITRPAEPGFFGRLWASIVRFFVYKVMGRNESRPAQESRPPAEPGAACSELRFSLEITPGGPMGPMINAMVRPALVVAAEDLARDIVARVEADNGA